MIITGKRPNAFLDAVAATGLFKTVVKYWMAGGIRTGSTAVFGVPSTPDATQPPVVSLFLLTHLMQGDVNGGPDRLTFLELCKAVRAAEDAEGCF